MFIKLFPVYERGVSQILKRMSMKLLETSQTISDLAIYIMLWHEKSLFDQF